MSPFSRKAEMKQAVYNLLNENIDDNTREEQKKINRAWIQYYKNKLKQLK